MIPERMKSARRRAGITLRELSGKTGISKTSLNLYENGKVQLRDIDKIIAISRALDSNAGWLTGYSDLNNDITQEEYILIKAMRKLPSELYQLALSAVQFLDEKYKL